MTIRTVPYFTNLIIPYQELLGNYDKCKAQRLRQIIIPYQELLGNYDPTDTAE